MIQLEVTHKKKFVHNKIKLVVFVKFRRYICHEGDSLVWSKPVMGMNVSREDAKRVTDKQKQEAYECFKDMTCTDSEFRAEFERRRSNAIKRLAEIRDAADEALKIVETGNGRADFFWLMRPLENEEREILNLLDYDRYISKRTVLL